MKICAVMNTRKKKHGNKYGIDWAAVAAQVPGRVESQCWDRWRHVLDPSIDKTNRLMSPPQAEDIPATKKPRLQEPFSASADEADTKMSSLGTAVSLPVAAAAAIVYADADPVKGIRVRGRWTPEEDAKLNNAVTNTFKTLDCNCRPGSGSNGKSVLGSMASCLGSQHRPG
jgi:hypothetical protein